MKEKKTGSILYWAAAAVFLVMTLGPVIYLLILSLTPESEILSGRNSILPGTLSAGNFKEIFKRGSEAGTSLLKGLSNSLKTSAVTVGMGLPLCILSAYGFYRFNFRFKKTVLLSLLLTMAIPLFTTIIPIYAIFAEYGLLDHRFWISVIYITSMVPLTVWILINYFRSIPRELTEAAVLDGAGEIRLFLSIILPVSSPIIITAFLMMFIMSWNQYQIPMILSSSPDKKVVTMIMSEFMSRDGINYGMIAASGILSIMPPAILAVIFRKFLVSGLSGGAVKG